MAVNGLRQVWRTLREIDLGAIKDEAEQRFSLILVGEPARTARLADQLSQTPGREGLHPWILRTAPQDGAALERHLQPGAGGPRLAILVAEHLELGPDFAGAQEQLRRADVPAVTALLAGDAAYVVGAEAPRPGEAARALVPPDADAEATGKALAPALMAATPEGRGLRLSLARQLPPLRGPFVEDLIEDVARTNAGYSLSTGLGEVVPGVGLALGLADVFVLTKNQLVMAYKISLASGGEGSPRELLFEVAGVLGGGLLFRQIARELVGLLPVIGLLPKVAVAYAGTRLIGRTVQLWADEGERPEIDELRGLYTEAMTAGRKLAGDLLERRRG